MLHYLAESVDFVLAHISVRHQSEVLECEAATYSVIVGRNHGLQWKPFICISRLVHHLRLYTLVVNWAQV